MPKYASRQYNAMQKFAKDVREQQNRANIVLRTKTTFDYQKTLSNYR